MRPIEFRFETAKAKISHIEYDLYAVINVYSRDRGLGHATGVMGQVVEWADKYQATLLLTAQAYGKDVGLDNDQLVDFYRKFGFVVQNPPTPPIRMVRHPSQKIQAP